MILLHVTSQCILLLIAAYLFDSIGFDSIPENDSDEKIYEVILYWVK